MRSRMPSGRRSARYQDRGFPLIPVLIGVVLVGFAIGAALSTIGSGGSGGAHHEAEVVVTATSTPESSAASIEPVTIPTLSRKLHGARETPYPAVVPTIPHTPQPTPAPSVEPTETPTASATLTPKPKAKPKNTPALVSTPVALASPIEPMATFAPGETPEPPAPTIPPPTTVPTPSIEVDSEFAQEAAQAARRYLTALQHGDEESASAALAPGSVLSEEAFMDRSARITRIHATGTSTNAAVQADVITADGTYVVSFSVERGPRGAIIRAHDYMKVKSSSTPSI